MDLRETKTAREYLGTAVFRLKAKVEEIVGAPGVDHRPPVTAVRWEKLSGPEMNAITQLLNGARFLITNPGPHYQCKNEIVHGKGAVMKKKFRVCWAEDHCAVVEATDEDDAYDQVHNVLTTAELGATLVDQQGGEISEEVKR